MPSLFTPIFGEQPSGSINGVNQSFSTAFTFSVASLAIYLNGLRLIAADYAIIGAASFSLTYAPFSTDSLRVDYTPIAAAPTPPPTSGSCS